MASRHALLVALFVVTVCDLNAQNIINPYSVAVAPTNSLKDSLVSYWTMNEASGTRADTVGNYDLSAIVGVGDSTGIIDSAAYGADVGYLYGGDEAGFAMGDIDYTVAGWFYMETSDSWIYFIAKDSTDNRDYILARAGDSDTRFYIFGPTGEYIANGDTNLVVDRWYYLAAGHDATNDSLFIYINGNYRSAPTSETPQADTDAPFAVLADRGGDDVFDVRADECAVWRRKLRITELDSIYNSGAGYAYGNWEGTPWSP